MKGMHGPLLLKLSVLWISFSTKINFFLQGLTPNLQGTINKDIRKSLAIPLRGYLHIWKNQNLDYDNTNFNVIYIYLNLNIIFVKYNKYSFSMIKSCGFRISHT